jgi:hypothetical protein
LYQPEDSGSKAAEIGLFAAAAGWRRPGRKGKRR